jgi:cysteine-rich repeat protein
VNPQVMRGGARCAIGALIAHVWVIAVAGCEDAAGTSVQDSGTFEAAVQPLSCENVDDGVACGEGRHCFGQRCVADECGDGIQSVGETCDDGNRAWGDGCDAECQLELPGCPDGTVAGDEECDDGNWNDGDDCSNLCRARAQCGNGRVDVGEECDDGNVVDDDRCSNQCSAPECRNGRVDPGEECDDGNIVDEGDGCTNACKVTVCGNGTVEKYETCDDGNTQNGDACPATCVETVCGNGLVEPLGGEVCERPRVLSQAGTGAARRGCGEDCRRWIEGDEDACNRCQNEKCRAWMGIDLVQGCFQEINPEFGADPADPRFIQACSEAVDCAFVHDCGFTGIWQAAECYCGSNAGDACTVEGPAADAPCKQEWLNATKASTNTDVLNRFSDFAFASGWAYFLLDCYRQECGDVCVPAPRTMSTSP